MTDTDNANNKGAASAVPPKNQNKGAVGVSAATNAPPQRSDSGGFVGFLAFIAFLMAGGAGGGVYYLWEQQQTAQQNLSVATQQLTKANDMISALQGGVSEEFKNKFKDEFKSEFKDEFKVAFKDEFKPEFKESFKGEFKDEFKAAFKDEFKNEFTPEFTQEFSPIFKESFKGEFKDEFKAAFKDEFKSEFKDEFKPEFKDEFKKEFSAEFNAELDKKLESSKADLQSETTRLAEEGQKLDNLAKSRFKDVEQRQTLLKANLDGLYSRISNISKDWLIAEADYLIKVANHRLTLEKDIGTAIMALALADKKLKAVGEPALVEVRESIARQLADLEATPKIDIAGYSDKLVAITSNIDGLPLMGRVAEGSKISESERNVELDGENWSQIMSSAGEAMMKLVTVRHNERPIDALIQPEQIKFLEENLRLKIEQARLALLQKDQALFQSNLKLVDNWIKLYYNTDDSKTQSVLTELASLKEVNLAPALPDVSLASKALHTVIARMGFARETTLANDPGASAAPLNATEAFVDAN